MDNKNEEFNYEIGENLGVLRKNVNGWAKEVNLVSWNGTKPKFDIRDWSEDHSKCSKGITLTKAEMRRILLWLMNWGLDKLEMEPADAAQAASAFMVFEEAEQIYSAEPEETPEESADEAENEEPSSGK